MTMGHGVEARWDDPGRTRCFLGPCPPNERREVGRDADRPAFGRELPAAGLVGGVRVRRRGGKFVKDFVAAWVKVMNADRFDLPRAQRLGKAA